MGFIFVRAPESWGGGVPAPSKRGSGQALSSSNRHRRTLSSHTATARGYPLLPALSRDVMTSDGLSLHALTDPTRGAELQPSGLHPPRSRTPPRSMPKRDRDVPGKRSGRDPFGRGVTHLPISSQLLVTGPPTCSCQHRFAGAGDNYFNVHPRSDTHPLAPCPPVPQSLLPQFPRREGHWREEEGRQWGGWS